MGNCGQMKSGRADVSVSHGKVVQQSTNEAFNFINYCRPRNRRPQHSNINQKGTAAQCLRSNTRDVNCTRNLHMSPLRDFIVMVFIKPCGIFVARASLPDFSDFPCRSPIIVFPKNGSLEAALK